MLGALIVALSAMFLGSIPAPGAAVADDPITGKWGSDGLTFLELQFDGKRTVTGTTIWRPRRDIEERAPIKEGTFDTRTGAVRLTGEAKDLDGKAVQYVIEGKVEGKSMSGTYEFAEHKGEFTFTRL